MAMYSSILAWKIPRTEEPGEVKSNLVAESWTWLSNYAHTHRTGGSSYKLSALTKAKGRERICHLCSFQFSSVQSLSHVWLFATPWTAACQASLSITNSRSLLKLMSIALVMPFNYLILCHPLFLPHSIFPSIRVFSNESVLHIRWPKYWSFSFSISPSNEYSGLISFRIDWFDLLAI